MLAVWRGRHTRRPKRHQQQPRPAFWKWPLTDQNMQSLRLVRHLIWISSEQQTHNTGSCEATLGCPFDGRSTLIRKVTQQKTQQSVWWNLCGPEWDVGASRPRLSNHINSRWLAVRPVICWPSYWLLLWAQESTVSRYSFWYFLLFCAQHAPVRAPVDP